MEEDLKNLLESIYSEISSTSSNVDYVDRHVEETNEKLDKIIQLLEDISKRI